MKRIIIAALLLSVVLTVCIGENIYIKNFAAENTKKVETLERIFYEDSELCLKKAEKYRDKWEKQQLMLIMFINHSVVDEITKEYTRLPYYCKTNDEGEFFSACAVIKRMLKQMKDDQRVTLDSFY